MVNVGSRTYLEIPGEGQHELPPLLVRTPSRTKRLDQVVGQASDVITSEDVLDTHLLDQFEQEGQLEQRRMELAVQLVDQYFAFTTHWRWGDSILEWIRQCETTFESQTELRHVLRTDVWPHAGRSSFVQLLQDKQVQTGGVILENAVGLRLTFRQPPPLACFSDQFLFYLNATVASTAYQTWARLTPAPASALPPERFCFTVHQM